MTDPVRILLVEDNAADANLIIETLEQTDLRPTIAVAVDGIQAMYRLFRTTPATLPDLILLDLGLPRMDGRLVLTEIKRHKKLKKIPVVVFTASESEEDILKSYDLEANCYVTKPPDLEAFRSVVKTIASFWLTVVKLP